MDITPPARQRFARCPACWFTVSLGPSSSPRFCTRAGCELHGKRMPEYAGLLRKEGEGVVFNL